MKDDRILFLLSRAGNKLKTFFDTEFKKEKITLSTGQLGILFLLQLQDSLTMSELSRFLDIDNSAITRLVDRLVRSGFVVREANPEDRRQFIIRITEKGRVEINKTKKTVKAVNALIKEGFSEKEIDTFKKVLISIIEKFSTRLK